MSDQAIITKISGARDKGENTLKCQGVSFDAPDPPGTCRRQVSEQDLRHSYAHSQQNFEPKGWLGRWRSCKQNYIDGQP